MRANFSKTGQEYIDSLKLKYKDVPRLKLSNKDDYERIIKEIGKRLNPVLKDIWSMESISLGMRSTTF